MDHTDPITRPNPHNKENEGLLGALDRQETVDALTITDKYTGHQHGLSTVTTTTIIVPEHAHENTIHISEKTSTEVTETVSTTESVEISQEDLTTTADSTRSSPEHVLDTDNPTASTKEDTLEGSTTTLESHAGQDTDAIVTETHKHDKSLATFINDNDTDAHFSDSGHQSIASTDVLETTEIAATPEGSEAAESEHSVDPSLTADDYVAVSEPEAAEEEAPTAPFDLFTPDPAIPSSPSIAEIAAEQASETEESEKADDAPIVAKKTSNKGKQKATESLSTDESAEVDDKNGDEDEDEEEEEEEVYEVEAIRSHRIYRGKVVKYEIKWKGYSEKENTMESATNIHEDCPDICNDYWEQHEPRPSNAPQSTKPQKRKRENSVPVESNNQKKSKSSKLMNRFAKMAEQFNIDEGDLSHTYQRQGFVLSYGGNWPCASTNWFEDLMEIMTVQPTRNKKHLLAYVIWTNGQKTAHLVEELHECAPTKLIDFYESKVRFDE